MNDNQEVKIGMADGDDSQELQLMCMRAPNRDDLIVELSINIRKYLKDFPTSGSTFELIHDIAVFVIDSGYRK